jgi:hypothetical protein
MGAAEAQQIAVAAAFASRKPTIEDFAPILTQWATKIAGLTKTEQDSRQRCRLQRFAV